MKRLTSLLFGQAYSVKRATAVLAVTALLSNILGLLRNIVFNRQVPFYHLDIYYASFRLPDLLFNVLIAAAISSAFIPVLTAVRKEKTDAQAMELANQVLSWLTLIFTSLALILALAMPWIMPHLVPGFSPDRLTESIFISRILLVQSIFFAWSFTLGGLLNGFNRFTSYAFAPLVYNLSLIVGGFLAGSYGINYIAYAVVVGAFLHFGIQLLEAKRIGFKPRFNFQRTPQLKEILSLMLPRSLSLGMGQVVAIVYTTFGSLLAAGSITIFQNMNDLQTTPTVIIANSLAVAFFPTLTSYVAAKQWTDMNALLTKVMRSAFFLMLPSLGLALVLRAQIVRIYIGLGRADWSITTLAIDTFVWFMVGIIPGALVAILAKVFYSFKDTRTPLVLGILSGAMGILTAWIGITLFHGNVSMLALAVTVEAWIQCTLYLIFLYRYEYVRLDFAILLKRLASYALGTLLLMSFTWIALQLIDRAYSATSFLSTRIVYGLSLQLAIAGTVGVAVYVAYSMIMHNEEVQWLHKNALSKRK